MKDILETIDEFSKLIKSQPCYLELKKQEALMMQDEETIRLSNIFSKAQLDYSDGLKHYDEDSKEIKDLYNKMLQAKYDLDSSPIVSRYYDLLQEVNEPLNYLQFTLISRLQSGRHNCK